MAARFFPRFPQYLKSSLNSRANENKESDEILNLTFDFSATASPLLLVDAVAISVSTETLSSLKHDAILSAQNFDNGSPLSSWNSPMPKEAKEPSSADITK